MIGEDKTWETTEDFETDPKPHAIVVTIFPFDGQARYTVYDGEDPCRNAEALFASIKGDGVGHWFANKAARGIMGKRRMKQLFGE